MTQDSKFPPENVKFGWILQCPKHGTVEAAVEHWTSGLKFRCPQCKAEAARVLVEDSA